LKKLGKYNKALPEKINGAYHESITLCAVDKQKKFQFWFVDREIKAINLVYLGESNNCDDNNPLWVKKMPFTADEEIPELKVKEIKNVAPGKESLNQLIKIVARFGQQHAKYSIKKDNC
jgi:hypothetical protein